MPGKKMPAGRWIATICLSLLPAAAAATSLAAAMWMALVILAFAAFILVLAPRLRSFLGDRATRFALIFSLTGLSSIFLSFLSVVDPQPALALSIYLPLSAVSGLLAEGAESLSRDEPAPLLGFASAGVAALVILVCGLVRELAGACSLTLPLGGPSLSLSFPGGQALGILQNPAGTLFLLAYIAAFSQWMDKPETEGAD